MRALLACHGDRDVDGYGDNGGDCDGDNDGDGDGEGDGEDDQELVARCEPKWKREVEMVKTRAEAFPFQSGEYEESV